MNFSRTILIAVALAVMLFAGIMTGLVTMQIAFDGAFQPPSGVVRYMGALCLAVTLVAACWGWANIFKRIGAA